ncbi:MAG: M48 family metalloprotease [Microscillaceae bacterium]|nr:M48 family metalloprotease [Microscillaceae bacterium]
MKFATELYSRPLMESLGWAILHSLWQGALIALLLALAWLAMRKNSSRLRYFVATTALFSLFVLTVLTLWSYYRVAPAEASAPSTAVFYNLLTPSDTPAPAQIRPIASPWKVFRAEFEAYFHNHLPLIVSIWTLGVFILMLRFLGGLAYLQRLKHYKTFAVAPLWHQKMADLAEALQVRQKVRLLESALAQVPMVIGYLRPMILLPIGTISGLTPLQVESILAHELAHIRRHDYLINLLQSLVEIALFFNPFVWWISAAVREERENCCDDLAVQVTGDSLTFAKTLVTLEARRGHYPELAMALAGQSGGLRQRVMRLMAQKNRKSTFSEGFLSALVLVFCLGLATYNAHAHYVLDKTAVKLWKDFTQTVTPQMEEKNPPAEPVAPQSPQTPKAPAHPLAPEDTIRFGKDFMIVTNRRGEIEIYKSDKKLTEEEYGQYADQFSVEDNEVKVNPNALAGEGLTIRSSPRSEKDFPSSFYFSAPKVPELIFAPPYPDKRALVMPPVPPLSPLVPHFPFFEKGAIIWANPEDLDFDFDFNSDFDTDSPEWKEHWEEFGKNLQETLKKYEAESKRYSEEAQRRYSEAMQRYAESMQRYAERMEEYHRNRAELEKRQAEQAEEYQRNRIIIQERQREKAEKYRENRRKIEAEMRKDGLLKGDLTRLEVDSNAKIIRVQGKKLEGEQHEKYKKLLKEYFDWDLDKEGFHFQMHEH